MKAPFQKKASAVLKARKKTFSVVGIGASAGGLEAVLRLVKHLPNTTGMAYVLIQHLDPEHDSALSQLLAKSTTLSVREIRNNTEVAPNCVHVIPPNTSLTITNGVLKLHPRAKERGGQHSIDAFFESLAKDLQDRAVAVILSGTATDGSLGIETVKAEGGITLAQDESAKYDSMPRSAIATGCVDFVADPEGLAAELVRIAMHPYVSGTGLDRSNRNEPFPDKIPSRNRRQKVKSAKITVDDPIESNLSAEPSLANSDVYKEKLGFTNILVELKNHTGVDFSLYKSNTILRRITRRIVLNRLQNIESYVKFLAGNTKELDSLYSDVLIHVTSFFRNPEAFAVLKAKVFPKLLAAKSDPIRIWILGCSTGQEAYSLAMTFVEAAEKVSHAPKLQIFATDLNEEVLEKARGGLYSKNIEADISPERLRRFFVPENGGYRINKSLREMCVFARQNLISSPPFSRMDLVSCRNLMIYLESVLHENIFPIFHYALNPNGFLLLGSSESIGNSDLFDVVDKKFKIYSKRVGARTAFRQYLPPQQIESRKSVIPPIALGRSNLPPELNALREADRVTLGKYAPPGVMVNSDYQIIQFRGATGDFLEPSTGKASFDLLKMARDGLTLPLRTAITAARKSGQPVRREGLSIHASSSSQKVDIEVIPLKNLRDLCFLIFFEQPQSSNPRQKQLTGPSKKKTPKETAGVVERARELAHELSEIRDYLQAVQEQNETTTEQLQASNEEITSANEELQSLNEELQTSKEELESTNEELTTVNEEMTHRNFELTRLNNDLNNFHASVSMPIVRLDRDLLVQHFTNQAEKVFNLVATDIGRPFSGMNHNLRFPQLPQMLTEAIDTASIREREVQDILGRWYSLRVRPYITVDKKIDGVVLVMIDIDDIKQLQRENQQSREYAEAVIQTVPPLLVLDDQLFIKTVNRSFCSKFGVSPAEALNHSVYDFGQGQWNTPQFRELFDTVMKKQNLIHDVEITHEFKAIGRRSLLLSARKVEQDLTENILLCVEDITERKLAERTIADASRSKDEFLATLAHELRTPLAPIRNSLEVMHQSRGNAEQIESERLRIQRQMSKMVRLIDDLMDVSRISRGKVNLHKSRITLDQVLDDVVDTIRALPEYAKIEVLLQMPPDPIYLDADPVRLSQIFGNLVSNACKYTNAGGKVVISVQRVREDVVVKVTDSGIGIDKEMLSRVFDMFTQVDQSLERTRGGLGLGLAIVRSLVQLHGGTVEASSAGLAKGSEFSVRLPTVDSKKPRSLSELKPTIVAETHATLKRRILVADDNPDSAESLAMLLKLDGHDVRTAFDGVEAVAVAQEFLPEIAMLDIGMPRLNGYDTAREFRKAPWGRSIALIALTGWGQENDLKNATQAGFNHHLVKPVDIADLRRLIAATK